MIVTALSFYSIRQYTTLSDYSATVDHTNKVITQLYTIEDIIKDVDIRESGYMLTRDTGYITNYKAGIRSLGPAYSHLRQLTAENKQQQNILVMLNTALSLRLTAFKNNIAYTDTAKKSTPSPFFYEGRERKKECVRYIEQMMATEKNVLQQSLRQKQYYQQFTYTFITYLLTTFGLITVFLFILMITQLRKRQEYQNELQNRLLDLKNSHAELEQIAFAASHDLQEPLRKIKMFLTRLDLLEKNNDNPEVRKTVDRITASATRMQDLVQDLVNLTSLVADDAGKEPVNVNLVVNTVLQEMDEKIKSKNADIRVEKMPVVPGYSRQFNILFRCLLDNALKFTRPGMQPVIAIRSDITNGEELAHFNRQLVDKKFYRITVSDNGIGFDNKYISKIFRMFQRLHGQDSEYEGKGIGLAICQRIMVNHDGFIVAHGHLQMGATFKLFFPVTENGK